MKVTFNIPIAEKDNFIKFICEAYDYTDSIYNPENTTELIPNPESRIAFAKRNINRPIRDGFSRWLQREELKKINIQTSIDIGTVTE